MSWTGALSERKNNNLVIKMLLCDLGSLSPGSSLTTDILEQLQRSHLMQPYSGNKISLSVPFLYLVCWDCLCTVDRSYAPSVAKYRDLEWASLKQGDTKALFKCQVEKKNQNIWEQTNNIINSLTSYWTKSYSHLLQLLFRNKRRRYTSHFPSFVSVCFCQGWCSCAFRSTRVKAVALFKRAVLIDPNAGWR